LLVAALYILYEGGQFDSGLNPGSISALQIRDWGYTGDCVKAMWLMLQQKQRFFKKCRFRLKSNHSGREKILDQCGKEYE